jgi:hypothetical protein
LNPSLLASIPYSASGYQYQNSYLDNRNFSDNLKEILTEDLKNFTSIQNNQKEILFSKLKGLYSLNTGINGFSTNMPGFAARNYGISVALVNTAIISPVNPGKDFFNRAPSTVTNEEITSLSMNVIGLKYKQLSIAYAFNITAEISFGVTIHYLDGKLKESRPTIVSDTFSKDRGSKDYLENAWSNADKKFSKIIADLSLSMDIGRYFKVALVNRNVGNPDIKTQLRSITLENRMIAGLALRPDNEWGIYVDMDITKSDLLHTGDKMQPFSFGIEKGFFNNYFFARVGFTSDLTENHFLGSQSNALYGLGLGFNLKKIVLDLAIGMNSGGSVKNLAVSGFILF